MQTRAIKPVASTALPLTDLPMAAVFPAADEATNEFAKTRFVRVWSDRTFHVSCGDEELTTDSLPVAASGEGVILAVGPGEEIAACKADGETDGTIWFTVVERH